MTSALFPTFEAFFSVYSQQFPFSEKKLEVSCTLKIKYTELRVEAVGLKK